MNLLLFIGIIGILLLIALKTNKPRPKATLEADVCACGRKKLACLTECIESRNTDRCSCGNEKFINQEKCDVCRGVVSFHCVPYHDEEL